MSDLPVSPTETEIRILRHALGLDNSQNEYRNHYCAAAGSKAYELCCKLVQAGLMSRAAAGRNMDGTFHVTTNGRAVARYVRPKDRDPS